MKHLILAAFISYSSLAATSPHQRIFELAKTKGKASTPTLLKNLQSPSWEVRLNSMKALTYLHEDSASVPISELLLNDPSLIVRTEAALSLSTFKNSTHLQTKIIPALLKSLYDGKNYRSNHFKKGNSDWVPAKSLLALRILNAKNSSKEILPLLSFSEDKKLKAHALFTIEQLNKLQQNPKLSFEKRVLNVQKLLK